jgi:hypothetical protein
MSQTTRAVFLIGSCAVVTLQFAGAAETESERLAKLEAAVKALQEQNAALKREVSELKGASPAVPLAANPSKAGAADGKSYVETAPSKPPVYVSPGASETKLALGGFIQG